jgi:hypothetical protein
MPHNGSNWLKLAENKFTQSDFTSFYRQVSPNYKTWLPFPVIAGASYSKFVKLLLA